MALWERRYIRRQLALPSNAATQQEPLPKSGILSGLEVRVAWTNGATGGAGEDVIDAIDRIEVIGNGSTVIFSLEGIEIAKWAHVWNRRRMPQARDDSASAVQFASFPVPFGRWLGDDELWLDLSRWTDVELRVQYSPTISAAAFLTGGGVLDVVGWFYERGNSPGSGKGYLRTTQIKSFTTAASGDEVLQLSRLNPYTDLMVYAYEAAIEDGLNITQVELSIDNGRLIPFTGRWVDIQEENQVVLDLDPIEELRAFRADNTTIETRLGRIAAAQITALVDNPAAVSYPFYTVAAAAGGQLTTSGVLVAGSALAGTLDATARVLLVRARGQGIGNAIHIPFIYAGRGSLAGVLQAPSFDELKLTLTQGNAGAATRVSTRELVAA